MERMYELIRRPVITEKTQYLADEHGKYTFEVDWRASKTEVKRAVEAIYGVRVVKVNTMIMPAKLSKQPGRRLVVREPIWKKAVVTLAEGDQIPLFGGG
ncbi:MAG: 50S ribosomal protein L23 [Anaerolineae bacterium]